MEQLKLGFVLVGIFLNSCVVLFPFKEPNRESFVYYTSVKSSKMDSCNQMISEGIYVSTYFDENIKEYSHHLLRFDKTNDMVYSLSIGSDNENVSGDDMKLFEDNCLKKGLVNKGFYKCFSKTIKYEILVGSGGHGYYFEQFEAVLEAGDRLSVRNTKNIRYRKAMYPDEMLKTSGSSMFFPLEALK